ncbi:DUF736 domain-containing protein [Ochrobactrum sp. POC9]|uniref:DUF736 domain-containing protein n=1 Tax=Ochrobactrum sp. POC9 TaxID=2203419 RepID=UPI000D707800|nr:DUF736 domain-containing protein [Ochrobactrum sp. POC9]PWU70964.1 DUF736 domain-containing protein [Ochrobactrum sp. POC9]
MATIGYVTRKENGSYEGHLRTLTLNAPVTFVPIERTSEKAPDFRILSNRSEVGAAWIKKGQQSGSEYVSVTIDTPELPHRIIANLGQAAGQDDQDVFAIIWNRP